MLRLKYETISKKNSKADDKPNEDLAVFCEELGIGMVLDGVSRDRENGVYPNPSPAQMATYIFSNAVFEAAKKEVRSGIDRVQFLIYNANNELRKYNQLLKHRFPAGTVGIVFSMENNMFHYGYIGDCYAAIIRDGTMRVFTECQTAMVVKHKKEFSTDEIRFDICNHVSHPCGYGVWDGNNEAMNFVKYGSIKVLGGDVLLAYTDGMKEEIDNMSINDLTRKSITEMMKADANISLDDQTCIRIIFEGVHSLCE